MNVPSDRRHNPRTTASAAPSRNTCTAGPVPPPCRPGGRGRRWWSLPLAVRPAHSVGVRVIPRWRGPDDGRRERVAAGAARRYAEHGYEWHGRVRWVPSPGVATRVAGSQAVRASRRAEARRRGRWRVFRALLARRRSEMIQFGLLLTVVGAAVGALAGTAWGAFAVSAPVGAAVLGAVALAIVAGAAGSAGDGEIASGAGLGLLLGLAVAVALEVGSGGAVLLPVVAAPAAGAALGGAVGVVLGLRYVDEEDLRGVRVHVDGSPEVTLGLEVLGGLTADTDVGARLAECDGWEWSPFTHLLVVCASPVAVSVEWVDGRPQPHRADGPAMRWPDQRAEHRWHGVQVPPPHKAGRGRVRRIRDAEVRRAVLDRRAQRPGSSR